MLTPKTGYGAAILHKNSMAIAARGPWHFIKITWGDAVDGPADGEPTRPEHMIRGATCEVCSAAICNIVDLQNAAGERITLGIDCAQTMLDNQGQAALKRAVAPHEKAKRDAAKARRLAKNAAENKDLYAPELLILDALAALEVNRQTGFAQQFGKDVGRSLRSGAARGISDRQRACMVKLASEHLKQN